MERSSSATQRVPRSSRLRALARRSASTAEGACATAGGHVEATVQLARRVARNPFVPWKAWRKEKHGYAAVPTAALPPPSDIHTSLRSIKAHRNPVQQVLRSRMKQCSRKGRRNYTRRAPEVESWGIATSPFTSCSKAAVSPENSGCSPPSTSTLSVFSSRPSSPVSAAAAAPQSPLSSRSFSLSTFSACSQSAVASRPEAPCVPRRRQQEKKRIQGHRVRGKYHQSASCEVGNVAWTHDPCVPAGHRGAGNAWRSSLSADLETGRRRWMLVGRGQHRQRKGIRGACSESLQQAEQSYYWPAAALHCRAAFPPPCSCACFRHASAASLLSHTEKLEARRLAFSASPDPCTRSVAADTPKSATESATESTTATPAAAQKCVTTAAVCSTAYAAAQSAISSTEVTQRAVGEDPTGVGERDNGSSSPLAVTSPAIFAASGSAAQTPGVHSASGASGAGLLLPVFACAETDTCACLTKATSVSEKSHLRRSEYDAWDSSNSSYPSPRGFFITLHSFKCRARRFCDTATPSKHTTTGAEVDGIGSRTSLDAPCTDGHRAAVAFDSTRAADPSAILLGRTVGWSQAATDAALEAAVSTTGAAPWSGQINITHTSETSALAAAGARSTQVVVCGGMERSAYGEATAGATASAQSAATTPPLAPLTSHTSGLSCAYTASSSTASKPGEQCSENGAAIRAPTACAGGGGEALSTCNRPCGGRCISPASRAPGNILKSFGAAHAAEAHETGERLLPAQAGGEVPEAASCAAVDAGYHHAPLPSPYKLDAVQELEQHSQYQHSCGRLLLYEDVRCTTQEQGGEQLQLQQKQLHGAQPGGHCKGGRQYEFCGSSMRRSHMESEGETDDSENGVNCRQKEELRWNCIKLTKSRINESLHCTLSR